MDATCSLDASLLFVQYVRGKMEGMDVLRTSYQKNGNPGKGRGPVCHDLTQPYLTCAPGSSCADRGALPNDDDDDARGGKAHLDGWPGMGT